MCVESLVMSPAGRQSPCRWDTQSDGELVLRHQTDLTQSDGGGCRDSDPGCDGAVTKRSPEEALGPPWGGRRAVRRASWRRRASSSRSLKSQEESLVKKGGKEFQKEEGREDSLEEGKVDSK